MQDQNIFSEFIHNSWHNRFCLVLRFYYVATTDWKYEVTVVYHRFDNVVYCFFPGNLSDWKLSLSRCNIPTAVRSTGGGR